MRAASEYPGAMIASRNVSAIARAVGSSTSRLKATIPPNADTSSTARATRYAFSSTSSWATPQGVLCLMMTAAGRPGNSSARASAASRSSRLLYESSLPCSTSANETEGPGGAR